MHHAARAYFVCVCLPPPPLPDRSSKNRRATTAALIGTKTPAQVERHSVLYLSMVHQRQALALQLGQRELPALTLAEMYSALGLGQAWLREQVLPFFECPRTHNAMKMLISWRVCHDAESFAHSTNEPCFLALFISPCVRHAFTSACVCIHTHTQTHMCVHVY
jgi:hypothetical protein